MTGQSIQIFEAGVLRRYLDRPERYRVEDSAIDGSITTRDEFYLNASERDRGDETVYLRYDKRRLADGRQALVAWPPDFEGLSEKHRLHWESWEVKNPTFMPRNRDPEFDLAVRQNLDGEFVDVPDDPIYAVWEGLRAVNRIWPIFRHEENRHLIVPHLNNESDYSQSHNELRKLQPPDNLDVKQTKSLLKTLGVDLGPDDKPFQLFRQLMGRLGVSDRIEPFERVSAARSPATHEIRDFRHTSVNYVDRFKGDCREVAESLGALAQALAAADTEKE